MSAPKNAISKYGLRWDPNAFVHPCMIDIAMYANDKLREEGGKKALDKADHMRSAIRSCYPETVFSFNRWSNQMIDAWCDELILTIWGSSSSGKSGTIAAVILFDLLAAPVTTKVSLCTSPLRMHYDRCFGSMLKWYALLPPELHIAREAKAPSPSLITNDKGGQIAGVICISTKDGDSKEDLKSKIGAHQKRNRFVVDEPQNGSESVLSVKANFGASGEYKEVYLGNPDSWFSPLGKASLPHCLLDDAKTKINSEYVQKEEPQVWRTTLKWRGQRGLCMVLDGRESPAIDRPELSYYLAGKDHLDDLIHNFGEDSMQLWTYGIGRMPPLGATGTLISAQDIINSGALEKPEKISPPYTDLAGLDPSQGGDGVIITRTRFGINSAGYMAAAILNSERINVKISKGDISGQIATETMLKLRKWSIPIKDFSCDANGNQGAQVDRIEQEAGERGVLRLLSSGSSASKNKISTSGDVAYDHYADPNTEILCNSAALVLQSRVTGLTEKMAQQMSSRRVELLKGKLKAEKKADWKQRNEGNSPDELDSWNCTIQHAIKKKILKPFIKVTRVDQNPNNPFAPHGGQQRHRTSYARRVRRASNLARRR